MLSSSVTVRLQNMSQEQFLSPLLTHFLEGVSSLLSVASADVFVFNVQPDSEAARVLNISFSAVLPGGQFFPSEALEEQLYLNRPRLNMLTQMQVTHTYNACALCIMVSVARATDLFTKIYEQPYRAALIRLSLWGAFYLCLKKYIISVDM